MTIYNEDWVRAEEAKRAYMDANSLYKTEDEHSSCGVGLVFGTVPARRAAAQ